MRNQELLKTLKRSLAFVLNSENYHNGGEPANRLAQELTVAVADIEAGHAVEVLS